MPKQKIDFENELLGKKINEFTAIARGGREHKYNILCRCSCGNERYLSITKFMSGMAKSCGCKTDEYVEAKREQRDKSLERFVGKKYGDAYVLSVVDEEKGIVEVLYDCRAKHGVVKHMRRTTLMNGGYEVKTCPMCKASLKGE